MKKLTQTKLKIIEASIELFNKQGFSFVTTRDIASYLSISRGNLSYHYPGKEKLLPDIYSTMVSERKAILPALDEQLSLDQLLRFYQELTKIQVYYKFFFRDLNLMLESSARVRSEFLQDTRAHRIYDQKIINQLIVNGYLVEEPEKEIYQNLLHTIWMVRVFWMSQEKFADFIDTNNIVVAAQSILKLFYPFLTKKGLGQYSLLM